MLIEQEVLFSNIHQAGDSMTSSSNNKVMKKLIQLTAVIFSKHRKILYLCTSTILNVAAINVADL